MSIGKMKWTTDYLFNYDVLNKMNEVVDAVNSKVGTDFLVSGGIADGDYLTADMSSAFTFGELSSIRFLNGSGEQVTPTSGTYKLMGSPDGVNFLDITNSLGDASMVAAEAYDIQRQRPSGFGRMVKAKIVLSGIVGATSFEAIVWRS